MNHRARLRTVVQSFDDVIESTRGICVQNLLKLRTYKPKTHLVSLLRKGHFIEVHAGLKCEKVLKSVKKR